MQGHKLIWMMPLALERRIKPPANLSLPLWIILFGTATKVISQF